MNEFNFEPGRLLAKKYEVVELLGAGWEGEVYLLREIKTGIERAGKFFFPDRNVSDRTVTRYAKMLHRLKDCPILIQYCTQEHIALRRHQVTFLVSEYVHGERLSDFLARQPGKRLPPFQALHLLYALAKGMEDIHRHKEYHGDLHPENIIVQRHGLSFDLKLLDLFHWAQHSKPQNMRDDICDMIKIFHQAMGGARFYAKHPIPIKKLCCGLKRSLILQRYNTSAKLRKNIEQFNWD